MIFSKNKMVKWLPHIVGLFLFVILPLFVFDRNNDRAIYWMYSYYYQLLFMIVAFYVNYIVIVPRFFFSKKRVYFFVVTFVFATLLLIVSQYLYNALQLESLKPLDNEVASNTRPSGRFGIHPKLLDNFFLLVLVLGFSTGMAIIQRLRHNEIQQKEIEKARVDSELAFLKNQISPHFFFNSLNNIYALIAVNTDKAQDAVEKLSGLMRYLIYESDIKTVELKKEFEFTQNYIDLMQQRLTSKVKLDINIQQNLPQFEIPPLIFIPFVENAFKHGISYREDSFLSVDLKIANDSVIFVCENSIPQQVKEPNKNGGVGVANIKKRLDLIYGDKAHLTMKNEDSVHLVHLIIPLK